jgi:hypothetical protein
MKKSDRLQAKSDLFENAEISSNFTTPVTFSGTDNPRYLRAIHALLENSISREQLDRIAGCSNGPALIARIRDLGLGKDGLPCTIVHDCDRDGKATSYGVYALSSYGRRAVNAWLRQGGAK